MKRLLFTVCLLLCLIYSSSAQVKVGVKAGANRYSEVYKNTMYGDRKDVSYYSFAGLYSTIPLTEDVFIRPEFIFAPGHVIDQLSMARYGYTIHLHFPLLIGYKPVKDVSVLMGPEFRHTITKQRSGFMSYKRFEAGISGGLNYRFWKNFSVDATYTYGLTNLIEYEEIVNWEFTRTAYKGGRSRSILLGLAYTFGKHTD